jgi:hypothetical protein
MSRSIQTLTLGAALGAAAFAGATLISTADADRTVSLAESGMGFVDVFGLIDQIVMNPEDTAARVALEADGQQQLQNIQQRNAEIQQQVQQNPEGPDVQTLVQEFQMNQQQMQGIYQQYQEDLQALIAGQIADAYKKVYEAAETVAAERNVDFIFATRPGSDLEQTQSITGVAQEILARPLIAPSESIDLTARVREALGLPEPSDNAGSILDTTVPLPGETDDAGQPDQPADEPRDEPADQPEPGAGD